MSRPSAIILSYVVTGLATARAISEGGVDVHTAFFKSKDPVRFSRYGQKIHLSDINNNEEELIQWIINYAKRLGNRPIVIPTSDKHALLLAKHYEALSPYCRLWKTAYQDLWRIISKSDLYQIVKSVGFEVIPTISEPDLEQLEKWSQFNPGPYILKPFYEGISYCALREKNLKLTDRDSLLTYATQHGTKALVIQRLIKGGDGFIFDCYGLCNANGQVLTMASHRRWRQNPADLGSTCFGEIPASPEGWYESALFENTARLLEAVKFHGIFGIEWLQDKETGKLYLIDFNARPFSSIGHLNTCGLNLPLLAYKELLGDDLSELNPRPHLKHKYWVDLLKDIETLRIKNGRNELGWFEWLRSILRCRSFAYWDWHDPGPGIYRFLEIIKRVTLFIFKKFS